MCCSGESLSIKETAYQVGLAVEQRFSPTSLDEHVSRVCFFHSVNLADLEEDHVDKDRDLHATTDKQNSLTNIVNYTVRSSPSSTMVY